MRRAATRTGASDELHAYPGVREVVTIAKVDPDDSVAKRSLAIEHDGQILTFLSTLSAFGTALDFTVAELSIESHSPADAETAAALAATWGPLLPARETAPGPQPCDVVSR